MLHVRWCSYSRLNALPTVFADIVPLLTLYPVIAVNSFLFLPRIVWLLHLPRPDGSSSFAPKTIGTKSAVVSITVPPDWKVSFSGTGSISEVGELYTAFISG